MGLKGLRIKNTKDALLEFDRNGKILHTSASVERVTGYSSKALRGRFLEEFFSDLEEKKKILGAIKRSAMRSVISAEEFRFRHKSGRDFFAEMILLPLPKFGKAAAKCWGILRDVTHQREADKRLEEAHAMRLQFTATVSHELRTPLSVIKETVAMFLAGEAGSLSDGQTRFLSMAKTNIERLEKLITETLDLKALDQGRKVLHIRENSVGELFSEIQRMKKAEAERKGLGLVVQEDLGLLRINFDRERILDCFVILLDFSIRISRQGDILIRTFPEGNMLRILIRAPSPESPCDDFSKLFLRFEPMNETERIKLGRTGVELARVSEIIEKHRGKVWAEFLPGEGTFFHILLPIWERRMRPH